MGHWADIKNIKQTNGTLSGNWGHWADIWGHLGTFGGHLGTFGDIGQTHDELDEITAKKKEKKAHT